MKSIFSIVVFTKILLLINFLSYSEVKSQPVSLAFGCYAGLNLATSPHKSSDFKIEKITGFLTGFVLDINFTTNIALTPQLRLISKGWKEKNTLGESRDLVIYYLEAMSLFKINFLPKNIVNPYLEIGPSFGIRTSAHREKEIYGDLYDETEDIDIGLFGGGGINFAVSESTDIFLETGYSYGLFEVYKGSSVKKNNGVQILAGVKTVSIF